MGLPFVAHAGQPLAPHDLWAAWSVEPALLLSVALTGLVYAWGAWNVWRRAGLGRGITARHWLSFSAAVLALVVALASPLDALSGVLFAGHMAQHMALMLVAAPLLVMSEFPLALLWALPRRWAMALARHLSHARVWPGVWRGLSSPVLAWLLFAVTVWVWHTTTLYEAALRDEIVHDLEHLAFLVSALLFWRVLLKPTGPRRVHHGMAIPYLFTTALHSGVLGALMTFTDQPWYPYYAALVTPWGLTPLQDQQLAGLIMWLPGGAVFTLLTIGHFSAWFRALEQRSSRLHARAGDDPS